MIAVWKNLGYLHYSFWSLPHSLYGRGKREQRLFSIFRIEFPDIENKQLLHSGRQYGQEFPARVYVWRAEQRFRHGLHIAAVIELGRVSGEVENARHRFRPPENMGVDHAFEPLERVAAQDHQNAVPVAAGEESVQEALVKGRCIETPLCL